MKKLFSLLTVMLALVGVLAISPNVKADGPTEPEPPEQTAVEEFYYEFINSTPDELEIIDVSELQDIWNENLIANITLYVKYLDEWILAIEDGIVKYKGVYIEAPEYQNGKGYSWNSNDEPSKHTFNNIFFDYKDELFQIKFNSVNYNPNTDRENFITEFRIVVPEEYSNVLEDETNDPIDTGGTTLPPFITDTGHVEDVYLYTIIGVVVVGILLAVFLPKKTVRRKRK